MVQELRYIIDIIVGIQEDFLSYDFTLNRLPSSQNIGNQGGMVRRPTLERRRRQARSHKP